ncbi:hypothetical protein [Kitasatospora sp. NPDC001683]
MEAVAAIEQSLRENPDDHALWLHYADRLLARGDARGTLIRLEQRRMRARPADRETLTNEITALMDEHRPSWDAELPSGATIMAHRYGLVTKAGVTWSDEAPALIEQVLRGPFVTALRIGPPDPVDEDEDDEDFELEDYEPDDFPLLRPVDVSALASLDLGRLTELDLSYLPLGEAGAKDLAASAGGHLIDTLDLRYCGVGDAGLAALAATARFDGLRRLHLQCNALTAEGVRSLHRLERLVELDLRYNTIGPDGADALLAMPFVGSLARLFLYRSDVSDAGATTLARAPQLPSALRSLWRSV